MTSRLWGAAKVAVAVLSGLSAVAPFPLRAAERVCDGTLLQIQVNERGTSRSDRFRFSLGLDAEDLSKDCLLYTSPSPRDRQKSRMPSSA